MSNTINNYYLFITNSGNVLWLVQTSDYIQLIRIFLWLSKGQTDGQRILVLGHNGARCPTPKGFT